MPENVHVCPVWVGYLLASPIRRLFHSPASILDDHLRPGMTALDLGCAMGYFSIPMAQRVGPGGRVICLDVQERMLAALRKRATKARVLSTIEPRRTAGAGLGVADLAGSVDFALAFAVMHELPDQARALLELAAALAPSGRLLIAEPRGHVSAAAFEATLGLARAAGLEVVDHPRHARSWSALLTRTSTVRA